MSRLPINIPKSKQVEKLILRQNFFERIMEVMFHLIFAIFLPYVSGIKLSFDLINNRPIGLSITFFILSLCVACLLIYSIVKQTSLKRINGLSRGQNSTLIKKIAKKNNWDIQWNNQQITTINFSWKDTGTDWGKQITILYDKNDILVNCISFGIGSSPSPFHWFANKRKVNKLKSEFENSIKNVLQQRL